MSFRVRRIELHQNWRLELTTRSHTIKALREAGIMGATKAYEEIKAGRLVARKIGRRTIILDEDLKAWLDVLPRV